MLARVERAELSQRCATGHRSAVTCTAAAPNLADRPLVFSLFPFRYLPPSLLCCIQIHLHHRHWRLCAILRGDPARAKAKALLPAALKGKGVVHASALQRGRLVYGASVTRCFSCQINIDALRVFITVEITFPKFIGYLNRPVPIVLFNRKRHHRSFHRQIRTKTERFPRDISIAFFALNLKKRWSQKQSFAGNLRQVLACFSTTFESRSLEEFTAALRRGMYEFLFFYSISRYLVEPCSNLPAIVRIRSWCYHKVAYPSGNAIFYSLVSQRQNNPFECDAINSIIKSIGHGYAYSGYEWENYTHSLEKISFPTYPSSLIISPRIARYEIIISVERHSLNFMRVN